MASRTSLFKAALLGTALAAPTFALAGPPTPTCATLGTNPAFGLAGNPSITGLTTQIVPAGTVEGTFPFSTNVTASYCRVDFTDVSLAGPAFGYQAGQKSKMKIRIGLPLNSGDGGTGGVQGGWNGKIRSLGNGGFAGAVVSVAPATNLAYIGSGTDTGHDGSISNPIPNPNPPPATVEAPPSENGAVFGLNVDGSLNFGRIMDYAWRSEHHANLWARQIGKIYYGRKHTRNYFVGCSDGGREAHEMAERYGKDFDGILAISPAVHWDRWGFSGGWGNYAAHQELGTDGIDANKFTDVNARALAACDAIDGIVDGLMEDTRKCHYDANAAVCGQPGASADPTKCLTPAEASVVNKVWDGPRNPDGTRLWVGWERGQGGVFGLTPSGFPFFAPAAPTLFGEQINRYWVHKNPTFNWRIINETQFIPEQKTLTAQWSPFIGSDSPDLNNFRAHGGKMIATYGNQDQVIPPRAHYNYVQRLFADNGGVAATQKFYRYYVFPGATHCGGSGMDTEVLFSALVNWVEHGVTPDFIVAQVNPTRTRKVCMYPNTQIYNGSGSTDDQANFHCQKNAQDDPALLADSRVSTPTAKPPLKDDHDISRLPGFRNDDDDDDHGHDHDDHAEN